MFKLKKITSRCIAFVMAVMLICSGIMDNIYFMSSNITNNISGTVTAEAATTGTVNADTFSWDNALVYFLLTDRFKNGDTSNDHSYNRGLNQNGSVVQGADSRGTFHGGDFKGITQTIKDGYFNNLGVNALWISAPYEQIHGYIVGSDDKPSFAHYSYHGYYVLDYTDTDANFGTMEEFKELVDTAHEHGIRVIMDIVLNHAGYNSIYDMDEYGFGGTLKSGWKDYYFNMSNINNTDYHSYIDYESNEWTKWWGPDWIRAGLPGYTAGGNDDLTQSLTGLPDFKTEQTKTVGIPEFLAKKWKEEGRYDEEVAELKEYLSSHGYNMTVTNCISYWLSTWVRDYGVDGFRCDTAKHVEKASWKTLKTMCTDALKTWKTNNPDKKLDDLEFWMTGEAWGHGVSYDSYYTEGGFDSMINFGTEGGGVLASGSVDNTYNSYASAINTKSDFNVLSYLSSHDSRLTRGDMIYTGSAFLLLPGGVQIYYGDETNRPLVSGIPADGNGGAGHSLRSDMNWDSMDKTVLAHWQKVGKFRSNHMAVGAGGNTKVTSTSGHAFTRTYSDGNVKDRVALCIGANANTEVAIDVSGVWSDGESVVNYYDDSSAVVTGGKVTFNSGANGTILIGDADGKPLVSFTGDSKFKGTQKVTVSLDGVDSAIVSVDGGKKFIVHNGDTFTIGETAYEGDTVTISYTAANENGTANGKVDFYKEYENGNQGQEENDGKGLVRVKMSDGSAPYLYAWKGETKYTGAWPGKQLTEKDEEGYYYYKLETTDTYNVIFNGGSGKPQTDDIEGLSGTVTFEISGDYTSCTKIETENIQSKYNLMKKEARAVKNMTPEDYTAASWSNLYQHIAKADELVALGEKAADAAQVETVYNDIVTAKNALVLAAPTVTTAEIGSKVVSGTAPCESAVKVTVNGTGYTVTADEVTGMWSIETGSDLSETSTIETSCERNGLESATASYTLPITTDSGKVIVKYVDESGNEIAQSKVMTGTLGTEYITAAVDIEGYTLKTSPDNATGIYTNTDITVTYVYQQSVTPPVEKEGNVIVRYVDESENELKTSVILTGTVGTDYETAEAKIEGYTLKTSPSNAKGKYTEEDITVTYVYQKDDINEKTGRVIVKYVDESDNEIKASTTLTGIVGADYETAEAKIEGYTLKTSPSNVKGKYTEEDITVTYVYKKNEITEKTGKVIVKYVDESDNQIKNSITLTGIVGADYETAEAKIEGYTLKTSPSNAKGKYTEADITVTYVYQKNDINEKTGKVIVRYVDESENDIKESTTLTGIVGADYETAEADIEGYTLKMSPSNAKGKYTEEDITVTYVYEKNGITEKTGKVIVKYVDESDNEIKESTILTGIVGADYETSEVKVEGYILKSSSMNTKGKYTEEDIIVTYVYKKIEITEKTGKVIVKYVDESNNEIKASITLTGIVGADYETAEENIEGYTLKTKPSNAKGKYTEEDITVTYVYEENTTPVYEKVSITSFKTSRTSNAVTVGQSIKMTVTATGGSGKLQYQFVVKRGNEKNQTVRKYSSDNSCQWKPAKSGKYTLYAYVKDSSTGKIVKKSIKNYNIKPALTIKSFTQSRKSGTAVVGDKVIIRINATGGIGQKFYRYYYKLNGKKYTLKNNTSDKKVNWIPKKAGKYQLFVEAVDDMDNKVTKKVNYVVLDKLKVKSLKANPSSAKVGQQVKLSAAAAGGTKGYSYKFKYEYKNKSAVIRTYSGSSNVMWTPKYKGKYKITVYVRDAKNRKATKTMTLNVK